MTTSLPHRTSLTIPTDLSERIHRLPAEMLQGATTPSAILRDLLERGVAAAEAEAEVDAYNAAYPEPVDPAPAMARRARVQGAAEQALHAAETRDVPNAQTRARATERQQAARRGRGRDRRGRSRA